MKNMMMMTMMMMMMMIMVKIIMRIMVLTGRCCIIKGSKRGIRNLETNVGQFI